MHRLVIKSKGEMITELDVEQLIHSEGGKTGFPELRQASSGIGTHFDFHEFMDAQEKEIIAYAMEQAGTTRKAASLLGLPQTTFARKKLKHGL